MKKIGMLMALLLLLSSCGRSAVPTQSAPTPTPAQTAPPTFSPSSAPTATPEPTPVPKPTATPAPRWVRGEEPVSFVILTTDAPGPEGLTVWLLGEGRDALTAFGQDSLGESMFTPDAGLDRSGEDILPASDESRSFVLAADSRLLDAGLLEALIPVFERQYGYSVEIRAAEAETAAALAREADMAILASGEAARLRQEGLFTGTWPLASTVYVRED